MPASLYNLANRKHHSESNSAEVESVDTSAQLSNAEVMQEVQVAAETNGSVEAPNDQLSTVEEQKVEAVEAEPADVAKPSYPEWDIAWSKNQLLAVAQSLNLSVTSTSTKSEIVNALTAATKA